MAEVQLVIFTLGKEEYAVEIMRVKEIVPYKEPVKIPNTPRFIEGVINLRGEIIPIISLKKRFNLVDDLINEQTRVIVVNVKEKQVGFIVDDASEVLTMNDNQIDAAPEIITGIDRNYIAGIGKLEDRILILLDLNKIFTDQESEELKKV